jgi:hypothetical protein
MQKVTKYALSVWGVLFQQRMSMKQPRQKGSINARRANPYEAEANQMLFAISTGARAEPAIALSCFSFMVLSRRICLTGRQADECVAYVQEFLRLLMDKAS